MQTLNKILKGVSENIVDRFVNILVRFIEPIIFINLASIETYGTWLVIFSLPAYIMISDLGFSAVGQHKINMDIKVKKFNLAQKNFSNTLNLSIILNIIFSLFFFLILKKLYDYNLLNLKDIDSGKFYFIAVLLIFYTFIHQLNGLFVSIYPAHDKYHFKVRLNYLSKIIETSILFFCLFNKYNFQIILIFFLINKILFFIFILIDTTKNYNWIKFKFELNRDFIKKNLSHALSFLIFPITNALKYQTTNLIINSALGPKYVALLSIYLTLCRVTVNLTSITDGIIKVELAKLWVSNQLENLKKIFVFNIQISLYVSILIVMSLFFLNQFIFKIWIGNDFLIDEMVFKILLFSTLFQSLFTSSITLLTSTNNFKRITFYNLINVLLFIIFLYVLININKDLIIVSILFLISELVVFYYAINFSSNMINEKIFNIFLMIFSFKLFKESSLKVIRNCAKS